MKDILRIIDVFAMAIRIAGVVCIIGLGGAAVAITFKYHAVFLASGSGVIIEEIGTRNAGIYVLDNGNFISAPLIQLKRGDVVQKRAFTLTYNINGRDVHVGWESLIKLIIIGTGFSVGAFACIVTVGSTIICMQRIGLIFNKISKPSG